MFSALQPLPENKERPDSIAGRVESIENAMAQHAAICKEAREASVAAKDYCKLASGALRKRAGGGAVQRTAVFVFGLCAIGVGCWWVSPAASMIVVGGILSGLAIFGSIRKKEINR